MLAKGPQPELGDNERARKRIRQSPDKKPVRAKIALFQGFDKTNYGSEGLPR